MFLFLLKYLPWLARFAPAVQFVKGNVRLIFVAILVIAALLVGWRISHLKGDLRDANDQVATLSSQLEEARSANASNQTTISEMESAILDLRRAVEISREESLRLEADAAAKERANQEELARTITELQALRNEEPSCEAISKLDIGAACPAAVQRLREQAARTASGNSH